MNKINLFYLKRPYPRFFFLSESTPKDKSIIKIISDLQGKKKIIDIRKKIPLNHAGLANEINSKNTTFLLIVIAFYTIFYSFQHVFLVVSGVSRVLHLAKSKPTYFFLIRTARMQPTQL